MKLGKKSLCKFHGVKDGKLFGVKRNSFYPNIKGDVKIDVSNFGKKKKK